MTIKPYKAFIAAFLSMSLAIPTMALTPAMLNYLPCFQQSPGKNYAFNCCFIDMAHIIRGLSLLVYYRTTHKKKNLDHAIGLIQNQLKEFETWLLQEEQNALIAIKDKFNMNNDVWNACLTDIQELKNIYKEAALHEWPAVNHDKNIPTDLLNTITAILLVNNLNPQSISIKMIDKKTTTQMQVRSYGATSVDTFNNKLIIDKRYSPLTLEIFPTMKNGIKVEKMIALCAHEIQHIVQHHGISQIVLESYLKHYCSVDSATLLASPEFQKFIQIHEAQAELLSAIKDPEIAHCLTNYRSNTYYPQYLYEEHYHHLSTVHMLWKLDTWLTWWQQFTINNITHDITKKIHDLADSFKELITAPQDKL